MDVLVNRLKLLAESLGSMQSRLAVFSHESQQRFPLHEIDLTRHGSLRRQLTRSTGNHRAQAEHFTRSGNLQDENFAVFGVMESFTLPEHITNIPRCILP